ncbi:GMC oxidoreductase [Karstenula rhodostoma CBS 690.94]|uniref:GMC oxidoreductase n=1 Tax=Karstenula rhodostoma CBS 690.94 TaxID=1392251 RepID=A0A9P4UFR3_9PLEO|nr:GMC oxidoreductase [Karstenula rhodostoma CBS 690.94]
MLVLRGTIIALLSALASAEHRHAKKLTSEQIGTIGDATFDYVIVGGGTAGLTIAARLASVASVAVVEAGGYYEIDYGNASVVPLYSLTKIDVIDPSENFPHRPEIDWELTTVPQVNANKRVIHYAQGKTLGGSSALNTMSYVRSSAAAYQRWVGMVGDDSYKFDNLLPHFRKSVHLTPPNLEKRNAANATPQYDTSVYGNGGPLEVSWNNWVDPTITWLATAMQAIGMSINPKGWSAGDLNGGSWVPSTIDTALATRESAETSFLEYALANTSLQVYPHSTVTKILLNGTSARGVKVETNGTVYELSARKEVIISAGTFHSPQLLMISGIGPKATLDELGIPLVADLPGVGQNLRDPISIGTSHIVNTISGQSIVSNQVTEPKALRQYKEEAAGPYSSAAGWIAYERLTSELRSTLPQSTQEKLAALPVDSPELSFIAGASVLPNGTSQGAMSATICNTFSVGSVSIRSAKISDPPIIDLGWFSDPADADILVAGIKRLRQVWATEPAQNITLGAEVRPGADVGTDAEMLDYIRANAQQIWHPSSTCSMGKKGDRNAVVDSEARVFGVEKLRVMDFSIVPFSIPGHPQATVYMLAEKIADAIKRG